MIYPGLDLAIVRPRAWVQYDLTYRTLGKAKQAFIGCFICIKNDLIEIALSLRGYFDHVLLAFIPKPYDFRAKLFSHALQ